MTARSGFDPGHSSITTLWLHRVGVRQPVGGNTMLFRYLTGTSWLRLRAEGGVTDRICRPKKGCRPCLGNHLPDPVEDPGLVRADVVG